MRHPLHLGPFCLFQVHETLLRLRLKRRRAVEVSVWIGPPRLRAGSVTSDGEKGRTKHPSPCPALFLFLVLARCSSPCGPPHSSHPASGPPRCVASAPLWIALSLCPSPAPSPHGNAGLYLHHGTPFAEAWNWTALLVLLKGGGGEAGSGRVVGKIPLQCTKHNTLVFQS